MLLTIKEVAGMLRISVPTVHKLCASGVLRSVRLSKRSMRVPKAAVDEYLRTLSRNEVGVESTATPPPREHRNG